MSNKNGELRERAIKQDELKNISGGGNGNDLSRTVEIKSVICLPCITNAPYNNREDRRTCLELKDPICQSFEFDEGSTIPPRINVSNCKECDRCVKEQWCQYGAIKYSK